MGKLVHDVFSGIIYSTVQRSPLCIHVDVAHRGGIFKLLRSPGIDSKESTKPAYVARRAGSRTLFLFGS
jgi:hypothetical protein